MSITQDTKKDFVEARKQTEEYKKRLQEARKQTEEYKRLQEAREQNVPWKKWGPYLSDRQWATVREDYSEDGNTWNYFSHDQARSRAYRWGEDGIFGISDNNQQLCFALSLWNGKDTILKERFFGLSGLFAGYNQGNHMEDVKEYYFYLDNTPTHSYMKALYKYPYEFPYTKLIDENNKRKQNEYGGKDKPEYELIDTGCFDDGYFDVLVEYAKNTPEDILIKITVWNRISEKEETEESKKNQVSKEKTLHILPTLWFRNTWSWSADAEKEKQKLYLKQVSEKFINNVAMIKAHHDHDELGDRYLYCKDSDGEDFLLFTENETNNKRCFGTDNTNPYVKDGINNYIVSKDKDQDKDQVNDEHKGTKASAHYTFEVNAEEPKVVWLRLTNIAPDEFSNSDPFGSDFEECFEQRKKEADKFYKAITPFTISEQEQQIQRQAFAGMLWNKQFYNYIVQDWLNGDFKDRKSQQIYPPEKLSEARKSLKNSAWKHFHGEDIISMPDKWEYPYFCVWDSAFHGITLALIDPDFAKEQLCLFTKPWYMNPDGQIPSCEFNFNEVNPPILAWAGLKVDEIVQNIYGYPSDQEFLPLMFDNLTKNLDWWLDKNRLVKDKYLFGAGFLGLDNISIVDRNQFLKQKAITIEQVDATSWLAMFCLNMLVILTKLDEQEQKKREDSAKQFLKIFISIVHEINEIVDDKQVALWDKTDNFYYEVLKISLEKFSLELPLKYRSILGIIPLFAVATFHKKYETYLTKVLRNSFHAPDSTFIKFNNQEEFQYLLGEEECVDIRADDDPKANSQLDLFLSIVNRKKLDNIMDKLVDNKEFLSNYGIRSLSKIHEEHPYQLDGILNITWHPGDVQTFPIEMKYEPAETKTPVHTGNSNWRGPIWFPMNFLIIESLKQFYEYFNICLNEKDFGVLFPSVSYNKISLKQVSTELSKRLIKIFVDDSRDHSGKRPVYGDNQKLLELCQKNEKDFDGQDLILFYEYFNGDTGQGLGASHQTGWTGLVANLIYQVGEYEYEKAEAEKEKMTQKNQEISSTKSQILAKTPSTVPKYFSFTKENRNLSIAPSE